MINYIYNNYIYDNYILVLLYIYSYPIRLLIDRILLSYSKLNIKYRGIIK